MGPKNGQPACLPTDVPSPLQACLIDGALSGADPSEGGKATKSGYGFESVGQSTTGTGQNGGVFQGFFAAAVPVNFNQSGTRNFCAIEDGVARGNQPNPANTGGYATAAGLAAGAETVCTTAPYAALQ
jgi:hypothetical protein